MKTLQLSFEQLELDMQRHSKVFRWSVIGNLHPNKIMRNKKIGLLMQYHDFKMIRGQ
jgi:hypothetical protein